MATTAVGDSLPDGTYAYIDEQGQLQIVSIHSLADGKKIVSLADGKKIVLYGVPGAFTPTYSSGTSPGNTQNTGNGNHQGNTQNAGNRKKRGIWKKILVTFGRIGFSCIVATLIGDVLPS